MKRERNRICSTKLKFSGCVIYSWKGSSLGKWGKKKTHFVNKFLLSGLDYFPHTWELELSMHA